MPAAVPLRPPPAPPPRSPERERLAVAIERYNAATLAVDRVAAAQREAAAARTDTFLAVERAEVALNDARESAPLRRTRQLIGEADDGSLTVPEAERALIEARAAYEAAIQDAQLLAQAATEAEQRAGYARGNRNAAIEEVLQASAALAALFAQLEAARVRADEIVGALRVLRLTQRQTSVLYVVRPQPRDDGPAAQRWRAALAALESDADAELPGDGNDEPLPPAAA